MSLISAGSILLESTFKNSFILLLPFGKVFAPDPDLAQVVVYICNYWVTFTLDVYKCFVL
jgi:hypothetical protein